MNLDDESLLSAFFDDELDPGERASVAGSVESSPELAGVLADFAGVRATILAWDRPAAPIDLALALHDRLAALGPIPIDETGSELEVIALPDPPVPTRRRRWAGPARLAASFVGVGSVAASLLLATYFLFHPLHDMARPRENLDLGATAISRTHSSKPTPPAESELVVALAPRTPAVPAPPQERDADRVDRDPVAKAKTKADMAPEVPGTDRPPALAAMLGQGRVVRVAVAAKAADGAVERVRAIVEQAPDRDAEFGWISLPPGLVVDLARPEAAEVFAVVLRNGDARELVDRLRDEFRGTTVEVEAPADLVLQLGAIGDGVVLSKAPPARLGPTPNGLSPLAAVKDARPLDQFRVEGLPLAQREVQSGPPEASESQSQTRFRSAPPGEPMGREQAQEVRADQAPPPASQPAASDNPKPQDVQRRVALKSATPPSRPEPVTVLIWVPRSEPR